MTRGHSRRKILRNVSAAALAAGAAGALGAEQSIASVEAQAESDMAQLEKQTGQAASGEAPHSPASDKMLMVGYCGIYCGLCDKHARIPTQAEVLRRSMDKAEYGAPRAFWEKLKEMGQTPLDQCCRSGKCGADFCAVRKCAKAKGIEICTECDEYPCERMRLFGECEPLLLSDGERIRKYGLDKWIEEQEQRRKDGFCYADIRCYPYHFPAE